MKAKKGIVVIVALCVMSLFTAISASAATCGVMSIVSIASIDSGNGGQVWLKNETNAACGNVAAGGGQYLFNLPAVNTDKTLAVLLTALSLGKNIWAAYDDSTNPGVLQIVSMQN